MWRSLIGNRKNVVFVGEAGSGKSELAISLSLYLAHENRTVSFFDMDQTKPLFRSRDVRKRLKLGNVSFYYEEQNTDAPTMVGGVIPKLQDKTNYVVLDVGGGDLGARLIGGIAQFLNSENTVVFYVINPFRPWSGNILNIDETLTSVIQAAHMDHPEYIVNPYLGRFTTEEDFFEGLETVEQILGSYCKIAGVASAEWIYDNVKEKVSAPLVSLSPQLLYPWEKV